jgi:hypothetical protein
MSRYNQSPYFRPGAARNRDARETPVYPDIEHTSKLAHKNGTDFDTIAVCMVAVFACIIGGIIVHTEPISNRAINCQQCHAPEIVKYHDAAEYKAAMKRSH